jgi:hypothetical protein
MDSFYKIPYAFGVTGQAPAGQRLHILHNLAAEFVVWLAEIAQNLAGPGIIRG